MGRQVNLGLCNALREGTSSSIVVRILSILRRLSGVSRIVQAKYEAPAQPRAVDENFDEESTLHMLRYPNDTRRRAQLHPASCLLVKPRNPNLSEKKATPKRATKRMAAPCKGSEMTPLTTNRPLMALKMMGLMSQVLYSAAFATGARWSLRRSRTSPTADEKKIMYAAKPALC
ncbi:hypothetical protein CKAH01_05468 [Colletotrichum kahawae]|uniref:Uncharacterized protein n=1 Tax=Colletotrichum kahawae TaxID=34407 RepID=A0AAD9YFH5_COLKA|nr:hypothetical protein CKAH01_05468 [Colletotrichum kahawae]